MKNVLVPLGFFSSFILSTTVSFANIMVEYKVYHDVVQYCADTECIRIINDCAKNSACLDFYTTCAISTVNANCQNFFDGSFDTCKQAAYFSCAQTQGLPTPKFKYVVENATCGNSVVEMGEACDDGNVVGMDTCSPNCRKVTVPYTIQPFLEDGSGKVVDELGIPVQGAKVSYYVSSGQYLINSQIPDDYLVAERYTNQDGHFSIPSSIIPDFASLYNKVHIEVSKPMYVPSKLINQYGMWFIKQAKKDPFVLKFVEPVSKPVYEATLETEGTPVKAIVPDSEFKQYHSVGRNIYLPYMPVIRRDLNEKLVSADVTLHVIRHTIVNLGANSKNGLTSNAPLGFHFQTTHTNVKSGVLDIFKFALPNEGAYYAYFEFRLHFQSGVSKTHYFYPRYLDAWGTGPDIDFNGKEYVESMDEQIKMKQDGSESAETSFLVFSQSLTNTNNLFQEVLLNHNEPNSQRMNVVFVNQGFDPALFQQMAMDAVNNPRFSFVVSEPFKGNINKLNFWTINYNFDAEEVSWDFSKPISKFTGVSPLSLIEKIQASHLFQGEVHYVILSNSGIWEGDWVQAGVGKCAFTKGVLITFPQRQFVKCLTSQSVGQCMTNFDFGRAFMHEIGHHIGFLGEEYFDNDAKGAFFDPINYLKLRNREYGATRKSNVNADPLFRVESSAFAYYGGLPIDVPNFFSIYGISFTSAPLPSCKYSDWADLIGNGCGQDGVVDCDPSDPDFHQEIGCHTGGGNFADDSTFGNSLHPSLMSIMESPYFGNIWDNAIVKDRPYHQANERTLCRNIAKYTEMQVGGTCANLCMQGCALGDRCIQGVCTPVAASSKFKNDDVLKALRLNLN